MSLFVRAAAPSNLEAHRCCTPCRLFHGRPLLWLMQVNPCVVRRECQISRNVHPFGWVPFLAIFPHALNASKSDDLGWYFVGSGRKNNLKFHVTSFWPWLLRLSKGCCRLALNGKCDGRHGLVVHDVVFVTDVGGRWMALRASSSAVITSAGDDVIHLHDE